MIALLSKDRVESLSNLDKNSALFLSYSKDEKLLERIYNKYRTEDRI